MGTKVFSGRADEQKLEFADAVAWREAGMSFGQYCSSTLIDYINATGSLPVVEIHDNRQEALDRLFKLVEDQDPSPIGQMSDSEIKELIASRYE